MVSTKSFTPNKGIMKILKNREKNFGKDHAHKDIRSIGNKDQRTNINKKKDTKEYKGQNKVSLDNLEKYQRRTNATDVEMAQLLQLPKEDAQLRNSTSS